MKGCRVSGCIKPHFTQGYCASHYTKRRYRKEHNLPSGDFLLSVNLHGHTKGEKNGMWRGGVAEYRNHYLMKKVRLEVLKEANYRCQLDGCGRKTNEIHHKDKSKTNYKKENFLAVCHKCHMGILHRDVMGRKKGGKNKPEVAILIDQVPVREPEVVAVP